MSKGRHRAPVDHHTRRALAAGTTATALATGGLLTAWEPPALGGADHRPPAMDPAVAATITGTSSSRR